MECSLKTKMRQEALEIPEIVEVQLKSNHKIIDEITSDLRANPPYSTISFARGSSDHAALYLNYLISMHLEKVATSMGPSLFTLYHKKINVSQSIAFAISQSGSGPDIITPIQYFKNQNSRTISFVNDTHSSLAKTAQYLIPLQAGKEESVAATKSFMASLFAELMFIAYWKNDLKFIEELKKTPALLLRAQSTSWSSAITKLKKNKNIIVLGRGPGLAIANEAALKFKETCSLHAEAFSSAEFRHGPMAILNPELTIFIFATNGPELQTLLDTATDLKTKGANVILAAPTFIKNKDLEIHSSFSMELDLILAAQSFYLMIEELAQEMGHDPDRPAHLMKITKTI